MLTGVPFGLLHYAGAKSVSDLPVLAMVGMVLCLVYERIGTLLPVIAVHVALNGLYAASSHLWIAASITSVLMISGCLLVTRVLSAGRPRRAATG